MSRFGNLELGGEHEDHSHEPSRPPLKGEAHFLAEAQSAFESGNFESALRLYAKSWNSIRRIPPRGPVRCAC
jgi:hypothetical protein